MARTRLLLQKETCMNIPPAQQSQSAQRDLLILSSPKQWTTWPYLCLVRRKEDGEADCGVLYDAFHVSGRTGYSSTVFLENFFLLPGTEEQLLALPHESYDTHEELIAAGWRVD
jgi:hypothetical protein